MTGERVVKLVRVITVIRVCRVFRVIRVIRVVRVVTAIVGSIPFEAFSSRLSGSSLDAKLWVEGTLNYRSLWLLVWHG